jgi:hypothetical protein
MKVSPLSVKFLPACALHADRQKWLRRERSVERQKNLVTIHCRERRDDKTKRINWRAGGMDALTELAEDKLVCPCVTIQLWAINWVEVQNPTKAFQPLALPACPG